MIPQHVRNVLTGRARPSFKTLLRFAEALEMDVSSMLDGVEHSKYVTRSRRQGGLKWQKPGNGMANVTAGKRAGRMVNVKRPTLSPTVRSPK